MIQDTQTFACGSYFCTDKESHQIQIDVGDRTVSVNYEGQSDFNKESTICTIFLLPQLSLVQLCFWRRYKL